MKYFLTFILCFGFLLLNGQENDSLHYNLSSPYYTIYTFLDNLQEEDYHPEVSAKAFLGDTPKSSKESAVKLKQILDGEGLYIEMEEIPKDKNYYDSTIRKSRFALTNKYPDIYVEKRNGGY